jgi:2-methylcitrate dehydratase PrpD
MQREQQQQQPQQKQQQQQQQASEGAPEGEAAAEAGQAGDELAAAAARALKGRFPTFEPKSNFSDDLEAAEAAAAEKGDYAYRKRQDTHDPKTPAWYDAASAAEAAAIAGRHSGIRPPSVMAYLALVHTYARAEGQLDGLFDAVGKLQQVGW